MVEILAHEAARASYVFQTIHYCSFVVVVRSSQGVIPFDEAAAKIWADLQARTLQYKQSNGVMTELSSASRMVVATALRRGATFVESSQPYHAAISGLTVVSP